MDPDKLTIFKYHVPGSVTAVKIDDDVILMGWYFYLHVNDADEKPHEDENKNKYDDSFHIKGRTTPAIILQKNDPGFEALAKAFKDLEENNQVSSTLFFPKPAGTRPSDTVSHHTGVKIANAFRRQETLAPRRRYSPTPPTAAPAAARPPAGPVRRNSRCPSRGSPLAAW